MKHTLIQGLFPYLLVINDNYFIQCVHQDVLCFVCDDKYVMDLVTCV